MTSAACADCEEIVRTAFQMERGFTESNSEGLPSNPRVRCAVDCGDLLGDRMRFAREVVRQGSAEYALLQWRLVLPEGTQGSYSPALGVERSSFIYYERIQGETAA
jgi:hypothetical protein